MPGLMLALATAVAAALVSIGYVHDSPSVCNRGSCPGPAPSPSGESSPSLPALEAPALLFLWHEDAGGLGHEPGPVLSSPPSPNDIPLDGGDPVGGGDSGPLAGLPGVSTPTPGAIQQAPPGGAWSQLDIEALVCNPAYAWDCATIVATIYCESRFVPDAVGHERLDLNRDGVPEDYYFVGFFQVLDGSKDPATNVAQAYKKWLAWQRSEVRDPWPGC